MKIALATTTIHVPYALKLMRKCSEDVRFFIAGDLNTPKEAYEFIARDVPGCVLIPGGSNWKCSEAIGWNTIARRNIAFLEALKWGADVIYSWDDDNIPIDLQHFYWLEDVFNSFHGRRVTGLNGWFDPGTLLIPSVRHRGFPYVTPRTPLSRRVEPATDVKVGVAAGLVIGDSDIDAVTRIELAPDVTQVHIMGEVGLVVDPHTWTIWNSQNTAVVRELIPSWFMAPGCKRHDDIFASLIVQRVMRDRGYHAHFGKPFVFQQRHQHDLLVDLRAEIDGMGNVVKMAELLDHIMLPGKSVIEDTRVIYNALAHAEWYPKHGVTAALAWLEDCESVL